MTSVECESLDDGLRRVTPGQERTADPPNSAHAGVNTQAVPFEKGRANAHRPLCIPCRPDPSNGITVSWPDCTRVCQRQQRRMRRLPARKKVPAMNTARAPRSNRRSLMGDDPPSAAAISVAVVETLSVYVRIQRAWSSIPGHRERPGESAAGPVQMICSR